MNKTVDFSVKLLSDMCCGNGQGNGSDVDMCCCFDRFGLPEIPAKRFKGLLREKALFLAENNFCSSEEAESLFGGENGRSSRIRVNNLRIKDADELAEVSDKYNSREISEVYSEKRYQTAVDKNGVTKTGSLRIVETVRKGIEFEGRIFVTDFTEADEKIIGGSLKLLRNIGLSKNRGLGEILCENIRFSDGKSFNFDYEKCDEKTAYLYEIKLNDDAAFMLNSPMQNPDYISGSVMVGALARYFSEYDFFTEMFFRDLIITNAYICDENHTYRPAPISMAMIKNDDSTVFNLADGYEKDTRQYVAVGGYVNTDGAKLRVKKVRTGFSSHIEKSRKKLFTINKIDKEQTFRGIIIGSQSATDAIKSLLDYNGGDLTIGASLTAQYGKCKMTMKPYDISGVSGEGTLIAELISDAVVCDDYGNNSVSPKALINELKKIVDFDDYEIYSKVCLTGGYNKKWGMPKQQYEAFGKGTTVVLKGCKKYKVGATEFIGLFNSEGYGQVGFRKTGPETMSTERCEDNTRTEGEVYSEPAKQLIDKIEAQRMIGKIKIYALEDANKVYGEYNASISNSAAMRILNYYVGLNRNGTEQILQNYRLNLKTFECNAKLKALAENILKKFEEHYNPDSGIRAVIDENKAFEVYLRVLIGRYKEAYQLERNGGAENE